MSHARSGRCAATLALSLVLGAAVPTAAHAGQLRLSSELQGAVYPQQPAIRAAGERDVRGSLGLDLDHALNPSLRFRGDLVVYASARRRAVADGAAVLTWRAPGLDLAAGLMREQWGRFAHSPADVLGPMNTPFSLVIPQQRLSQPAIRGTAMLRGVTLDVYALASARRQPLPEHDGRFGLGVDAGTSVQRGPLGDAAIAARVSATSLDVDWSAHVFRGASPRPTFVPRPAADLRPRIDAAYTDITQVGGDVETTRADWRFVGEGFVRTGGLDVTGRARRYGYLAAAAEYQHFGAFDGAWHLIPRFEASVDTRGDRVDMPFASSLRAGVRLERAGVLPVRVEGGWSYDWVLRGHGAMASMEKPLGESPTLNLGVRATGFSAGARPSVLDVWRDDFEIYSYLRLEFSR